MKKKRIIIVLILVAMFLIIERKIELSRALVVGKTPVMVHLAYAQKRDIKDEREYLADVQPENQTKVASRINAVAQDVYVDEGVIVKRGGMLANLEDNQS